MPRIAVVGRGDAQFSFSRFFHFAVDLGADPFHLTIHFIPRVHAA